METTLNEYLQVINDLEEGLVELNPEELGIVFDSLKLKIDGYVELAEYMKDRAAGIKERGKKLLQQAKYLENSEKRLKKYLAFLLETNDTPEILGNIWRVSVRKTKKVVTTTDPDDKLIQKYPELMKQKIEYTWDKTALKQALKNQNLEFAEIEETLSLNVRVNK